MPLEEWEKINKRLQARYGRIGDMAKYRAIFNHPKYPEAREWRWGIYDKFCGNLWTGQHQGLAERGKYSYLPTCWILEQWYMGPMPEEIKVSGNTSYEFLHAFFEQKKDERGKPVSIIIQPLSYDACCAVINAQENKIRKLFENHDGRPHYTRDFAAEEEARKQKEIRSDMDKIETRSELFAFESAVGYTKPTPFWTPDGKETTFESIKEVTNGSRKHSDSSLSSPISNLRPETGSVTGNKHKEVSSIGSEGVRRL